MISLDTSLIFNFRKIKSYFKRFLLNSVSGLGCIHIYFLKPLNSAPCYEKRKVEVLFLFERDHELTYTHQVLDKSINSFQPYRNVVKIREGIADLHSGFIYDHTGIFIAESKAMTPEWCLKSYPIPKVRTRFNRKITQTVIPITSEKNYFHWITEVAAPAFTLKTMIPDAQVVYCSSIPERYKDFIQWLGLQPQIAPAVSTYSEIILIEKAAGRGASGYGFPRVAKKEIQFFRERNRNQWTGSSPPAGFLWLSRRGSSREPKNIRAFENWLSSMGVFVIHPEDYAIAELAATVGRARYIMGLHGANLANLIFAHSGANCVEFLPVDIQSSVYSMLASVCNVRHQKIVYGHSDDSIDSNCKKLVEGLWSSQTLMDTCLGMLGSGLKFIWTNPTEMLVSTGSVVEQFDVV